MWAGKKLGRQEKMRQARKRLGRLNGQREARDEEEEDELGN
jgi:hypothetical protein